MIFEETRIQDCNPPPFLDRSAAFDTTDHGIQLDYLQETGIEGPVLEWFAPSWASRRDLPTDLFCGAPLPALHSFLTFSF